MPRPAGWWSERHSKNEHACRRARNKKKKWEYDSEGRHRPELEEQLAWLVSRGVERSLGRALLETTQFGSVDGFGSNVSAAELAQHRLSGEGVKDWVEFKAKCGADVQLVHRAAGCAVMLASIARGANENAAARPLLRSPVPARGQGKVTRGWTKIVDHTAYMGQAEGFQGLCPPDWALELAMSCNTPPGCLSTAAREVLHSWAEPLIKEADEYGGYITAKRPTRVECWIRVQTRNPNDLLSALTPEKGSVVYISPGASIDLIRNSGYACVWSDDDSAFWGDMHLIGVQSDELD